jgi:hypothetical protein
MTKASTKSRTAGKKRAPRAGGKARKPVDLGAVRQQINDLVGGEAVNLVEITIAEADKGHYGAMKYLFEMIGLYPSAEQEAAPQPDSLAKTLLRRLGLPEDTDLKPAVTKDNTPNAFEGDAVE